MSDTISEIVAYYSIFLIIVGTLGNFFTIYLIASTKLKNTTTFVFFAFLSLADIMTLYWWNLDHFTIPLFKFNRQKMSTFLCSFDIFMQFSFFQASAYFLVIISFDRYLLVKINNWNKIYLTAKRALSVSILVILILLLLNLNVLFTFGVDITVNETRIIQCYATDLVPSSKFSNIWRTVTILIIILYHFELLIYY